jgi:GNAT superfamily N-acetyltransferase
MAASTLRCPAVLVRTVDASDAELCRDLGAIVLRAYTALPGHVPEADYERELADLAARAAAPETSVLAAFDDAGAPLGCVTYVASSTSPLAEMLEDDEAGFRMLGVDPDVQRAGAGRALVVACIDRARLDGRSALCLHSTTWMTAAHRLYESLGFRRDPARDWVPVPHVQLLGYRLELG